MILSNAAIDNRTVIWVLIVLIVMVGGVSYVTLPRESSPDIPIPFVIITTSYEGVSPEDVESSITIKLEKEVAGIKGIKEVTSVSSEGMSTVVLEFLPDVLIEDALQYVRDRVDQVRGELPSEAEEPTVREISFADFPIFQVSIYGDVSPVQLKAIADELEDVIEEIPGVLNCDVVGALEREIRLEIDHDRFISYGLTVAQLLALVPSENLNVTAGNLETPGTKLNVRVPAEFADPEEVEHLILAVYNGRPIYLSDVGTVRDTFKDRSSYSRLDGFDSITLSIQKRTGADIVPIAEALKQVIEEAKTQVPAGVNFVVTLDQSKDILKSVADLENNIMSGLVLVVVVLFLFLGWRTSVIVAIAIPTSMLISFAVIQIMGYTLNMVVLFGLMMALGMLVDNAIVIVENIYRHIQMGYSRIEAAKLGTSEVAWPVITSTATTLAAFSPMLFWPDIMGEFMKYLPITLIITLTSSLFVALVINPTVCSVMAGGSPKKDKRRPLFLRGYRKLLRTALEYRVVTLTLSLMFLFGIGILYSKWGHGVLLFSDFDPLRAYVEIRTAQGTAIEETDRLARDIEERLSPYLGELDHIVSSVGSAGGFALGSRASGPHIANVNLLFKEFEDRPRPSREIITELRKKVEGLSGAEIDINEEEQGPPTGSAVTIQIVGKDFGVLEELSEEVEGAIQNVPGLVNLKSDHESARPELAFKTDRQRAMLLGVNTAVASNFLKTAILGNKVGTYRQFRDEYDITIRLPADQRVDVDDLLKLQIPNISGEPVPLSSLGEFEYRGGLGTIRHLNQRRVITLTGDAEGRLGTDVLLDVQQILSEKAFPAGYEIRYAGEKEEQDKAQAFLTRAFLFALLGITMILVAQFNSLIIPFIIMTTVVLSLIGVLVGLLVAKLPFSIVMTGVGVISLAGVVVNNAIVLLYYTRQLQQRGLSLLEATVEAVTVRIRPVLLSTVTTILGLVPMAIGISYDFHVMEWAMKSESSQWWASMAIAVIFGLGFASMLTLIVVPTLYYTLIRLFGGSAVSTTTSEPFSPSESMGSI
ncbi:MAG: efflux RND transporter permease subunit [Acidobacteriota bacterium]|nr:MAG: efflux RND transporter permease subunit [Acidobacteriota bacterium]